MLDPGVALVVGNILNHMTDEIGNQDEEEIKIHRDSILTVCSTRLRIEDERTASAAISRAPRPPWLHSACSQQNSLLNEASSDARDPSLTMIDERDVVIKPEGSTEMSTDIFSATSTRHSSTNSSPVQHGSSDQDFVLDLATAETDRAIGNRLIGMALSSGPAQEITTVMSTLDLPTTSALAAVPWLMENTFFGKIIAINCWPSDTMVQISFEGSDAAHLYLGLLRFAGSTLPDFSKHFQAHAMLNVVVRTRPYARETGTRVLLLQCNSSAKLADLVRQRMTLQQHTALISISTTVLIIAEASIATASRTLNDVMSLPRPTTIGTIRAEYGPDPACLQHEDAAHLAIPHGTDVHLRQCLRMLQALALSGRSTLKLACSFEFPIGAGWQSDLAVQTTAPFRNTCLSSREAVSMQSASQPTVLGPRHLCLTCKCFYGLTAALVARIRQDIARLQAKVNLPATVKAEKLTHICACGLHGIWRGSGQNGFFVPFAPRGVRGQILKAVHVRQQTHAKIEATLSRAIGMCHFGSSSSDDNRALAEEVFRTCSCHGATTAVVPAQPSRSQLENEAWKHSKDDMLHGSGQSSARPSNASQSQTSSGKRPRTASRVTDSRVQRRRY